MNINSANNCETKSPPYSADLNPIEMVWNEMENFVRDQFCQSPEKVAYAIETFRKSLTPVNVKIILVK